MIRQCKICGKQFVTNSGTKRYCDDTHYQPCPICGKPSVHNRVGGVVKCCSKACVKEMSNRSKAKVKHCEYCGKEFTSVQANAKYCKGPHHTQCKICGGDIEFGVPWEGIPNTCGKRCAEEYRQQNNIEKYGVHNVSLIPEVQQKIRDANTEEVKARRRETTIQNWGVGNVSQSEEVKARQRETFLANYGVDNPMKDAEIAKKFSCTVTSPESKAKFKQRLKDKYGPDVNSINDVPHIRDKMVQTCMEHYGVPYYVLFEDYRLHGEAISVINRQLAQKFEAAGLPCQFEFVIEDKSYDLHLLNTNILIEINPIMPNFNKSIKIYF